MKKITASLAAAMLCVGLAGPAAAATYSLTYPQQDLPLDILEGDWNYFDITDLGRSGAINDVNVFVDITHTYIADLDIYILHQAEGSSTWKWVQLYNEDGDNTNNMPDVTFDDDVATSIADAPTPYVSGSYKPSSKAPDVSDFSTAPNSNQLSFFDGDLASGTWSLAIWDNYGGETGTLNAFRLDIETAPPQNAVPLPGAVVLFGSGLGALVAVRRSRQK
jgi:subtilisin-like proprotein convertase family protein